MKIYLTLFFIVLINLTFSQDDRDLIHQIDSINSSALSHLKNNEIVLSFQSFNKVKKISDSINDNYGKAFSNFYLGNIYNLMQEYENAERSYKAVIKPATKINDNYLTANAYLKLGELYQKAQPKENIISHFKKALFYITKDSTSSDKNYTLEQYNDLMLNIRIKLCEFYLEDSKLDEALIHLLRLEESMSSSENANPYFKGYYNYIYGQYYAHKNLHNNATIKFNEAISDLEKVDLNTNYNGGFLLSKAYKELSLSLVQIDKKEEAYLALLNYNDCNDEFVNREKARHEAIVKSKFLIEDYKNDALIANSEKLRQFEIAKEFRRINIVITVTLVLLAISLITLFRNYLTKRKLSETLKQQNEELVEAKNEALKSSELKSKFISNVTHELRTPLYGVVGITSLLLSNNSLNSKDSKLLESLKYSGDYLLSLVNEVLQFGKIENQKIELKKVSVDIKHLVENIARSFDYKLQETNNEIKTYIDDHVPQYVECDNVRLSQVLINLIGNSIKFTKNGCVNIYVKTLNILNDKVDLRFEIQDNGIGIPEEKFNTIFENFSQLENSNINYQGTGLGLSITKKIVELFGSKIELESKYGFGSTFSFNVTFKIDQESIKANIPKSDTAAISEDTTLTKDTHNILIVEDNKINQIVTKNLLEKQDYKCMVVENGVESLNLLRKQDFSLILMDINMPVMGGIEATKLIREFDLNTPIIALTAADVEDLKQNFKSIGFNGIITKPFDNYEFFQTIETNIQMSLRNNAS